MVDPLEHFAKDYHGQTYLDPLGLVAVLVLGALMLVLPRRYAVLPMIAMACFVVPSQRIALFTLNFDLLRVMVLFGTVRVVAWNEWRGFVFKPMDGLVVAWCVTSTVAFTTLYSTAAALKFKLGVSYDAIGMYFLFRCLIREWDDLKAIIWGISLISIPEAGAFLVEWLTGRNLFAVFGGAKEFTIVREGRLRCQGPFPHSILAGCFWAAMLPLIVSQWWVAKRVRPVAVVATGAALFIVLASASSTPVMAVGFAGLGAAAFVARGRMRWVRWAALILIVSLHLVMRAPVWHLIGRVSAVGGSTGYHRYLLIDRALSNFGEWWLVGTRSTAHWGTGLQDVTNQYVLEGIRGGILSLGLFVALILYSFRHVGVLVAAAAAARDQSRQILAWALGVSLFVHATSFIGVSYFGQIMLLWYLALAMIASMNPDVGQRRRSSLVRGRRRRASPANVVGSDPSASGLPQLG